MNSTRNRIFIGLAALAFVGTGCAQSKKSDWTGTWKSQGSGPGGKLECVVEPLDGEQWKATFTGYCNREFAYKVQMDGRQKKKNIFFQGHADLGETDGGTYTWTGQIKGDTFVGIYSGAKGRKAGSFSMRRKN
ncbi:MAG: hypothetical protein DHS20C16_11900 [Phycisphaerae bacterium]|nr:MAG: hypothetical protein DHS20C16_11900 [Phycisphaerae bacterium]